MEMSRTPIGTGALRRYGRRPFHRHGLWGPRPWLGGMPFGLFRSGTFSLMALARTGMSIKLHQDEVRRIEEYKGRRLNELSEEELLEAMRKLKIENHRLDAEELLEAQRVQKTSMDDLELLERLTQLNYTGVTQ
ncbi:hypothetical protein ACFLYP_02350 [Chloroflexota bacterium]